MIFTGFLGVFKFSGLLKNGLLHYFPSKLQAMQAKNKLSLRVCSHKDTLGLRPIRPQPRPNAGSLWGAWRAILHDLILIQFDNLPDDSFLIRNVIVNIHSHTDIGVSHHILNNLNIFSAICYNKPSYSVSLLKTTGIFWIHCSIPKLNIQKQIENCN